MSILKKTIGIIAAGITAATAGVAVQNALQVKTDEEAGHKQGIYEKYVKRPQDFFCASLATIGLSPVLIGTAIAVRAKLGSPVLFKQQRPGAIDPASGEEKIFDLYKFRTMTNERGADGELLPDEDRLTKFGAMLRSTSLDELPELINIIKGDMAIIGPRPLLVRYLERYSDVQRRRHQVRPGISGLAQVNGRNAISWEEKFSLDVQYVDDITFAKDWGIIVDTVKTVIKHDGINSATSATMEEFMGTDNE